MNCRFTVFAAISFLTFPLLVSAQTTGNGNGIKAKASVPWDRPPQENSVEVLSDTGGVNLDRYLGGVLSTIRTHWFRFIPESARKPVLQQGKAVVKFSIQKSGEIAGLELVLSSFNASLDQAAIDGVSKSAPFPPLPAEFLGPLLTLRISFLYNMEHNRPTGFSIGTSSIRSQSNPSVKVTIFPHPSFAVPVGASRVITAVVDGSTNTAVNWSIIGLGCTSTSCGKVSGGLYYAPTADELLHPLPLTLKLTATSEADPSVTASIIVIVRNAH